LFFMTGGNYFAKLTTAGFQVGNGAGTPTARLQVKGSGTTSATTSLLVQNSAGTDLFKVEDGGLIDIGDANGYTIQSNLFSPKIDGYVALNRSSNRTFNIVDSGASRTYLKVQTSSTSDFADVSINTDHLVIKKEGQVGIGIAAPTSKLHIKGDGTGTANYSFKVQNAIGNNNMQIRDDGAVFLTNNRYTFNAAGGAVFKGSGTTSATTALLVQNSAGTDLLKVLDDGSVFSNGGGAKISSNTGFGEGVLASVTTANNTSAFGVGALRTVTTGVSNTGFGWRAGYSTTGSNNAFVGVMAGYTNSSGANNTGVGTRVLYDNATGSDNTAIGYLADSAGFNGSVILGREATATADNQFVVGSSVTNAGTVANIGDPTPTHTWEVVINGTKYRILLQEVV